MDLILKSALPNNPVPIENSCRIIRQKKKKATDVPQLWKVCTILLLGFLYAYPGWTQSLHIARLRISQELPSLTINKTFQDSEGFIWFGTTEGICRYDGYGISTFKLSQAINNASLTQNIVTINELDGRILIGAHAGLFVIHKNTYKAVPFPDERLSNSRITDLLVDRQNRLWVGTSGAIYVYNADFSLHRQYQHHPEKKSGIPRAGVNSFFEDKDGMIWVSFWEAGLFKLDTKKDTWTSFPKMGNRNNPYKVLQDQRGQYWVCTWGDGLFLLNPDAEQPYTDVSVRNKRRKAGNEYLYYDIIEDHKLHYIWVLSFSGISAFQYTASNELEEVDLSGTFDHTANIFSNIFQDRHGMLWLCIPGEGVVNIRTDHSDIANYTLRAIKDRYSIAPNLTALYRDSDGEMWFNQERIGLGVFNATTGEIRTYSNSDFKDIISLRAVNGIIELNHELWIGAAHEPTVNVFRKNDKKLVLLRSLDLRLSSPDAGFPLSFLVDKGTTLWLATTRGLMRKRGDDDLFYPVAAVTDHVVDLTLDEHGHLWAATKNSGIYCIDPRTDQTVLRLDKNTGSLRTNQIETATADSIGQIWIGTKDKRLLAYDIGRRTFKEYANALLFSNERLIDIAVLRHNIWLSTTRHIYKLDPTSGSIIEFSQADGFQVNMFNKKSHVVDSSRERIYFAGHNGLVVFHDSPIQQVPASRAFIADIKINNRSVIQHDGNSKFDFRDLRLTLNPDEQNIEISFTSLAYADPDKIRYAYKLEGVDKNWVYAPRGRVFATYNNLGKGKYRFLLKATDLNNNWSSSVTEVYIEKKPAFYESNVAYVIYFLTAVGLIYFMISFALNRLKLRSDLRIAQIEKEKANELIQTKLSYFTSISHDLLTPLTIISCLIDDIQITTRKNLSQFEKMRFNLDRLKRLLQQILDFRRVENKQMILRVSHGSINRFIEELCAIYFSPLAKRKEIDFVVEAPEVPIEGYFDMDKLDKILFNLLSNAFKYTPSRGRIELSYRRVTEAGKAYMLIEVKDSGLGIAPEEIDRIFIPFYNNTNAKQQESNGIGLALTKELVEIHRGQLRVKSVLQQGSCFSVRIPLDKESYLDEERKGADQPFHRGLSFSSSIDDYSSTPTPDLPEGVPQLHLLLVEDNEDLRQTMSSVLSRNYRIHEATHGDEALALLQQHDIDIIISDIMMPVMDGLTFCKHVKSNQDINHIPIILLTAKNSIEDRIECYQAGADGYISKPFELKVLEAKIHSFVINKRTKQLDFKTNPQINISSLDHTPLDEQFLKKMIHIIEEHLSDSQFDVQVLGDKLALSKSTLYRKTKVLLNQSPSEFIKNIRLKHACQIMENDQSISVSEVAFATGFSDPRYFSTCFKAEFGMTPSEFQKRPSGSKANPLKHEHS